MKVIYLFIYEAFLNINYILKDFDSEMSLVLIRYFLDTHSVPSTLIHYQF